MKNPLIKNLIKSGKNIKNPSLTHNLALFDPIKDSKKSDNISKKS